MKVTQEKLPDSQLGLEIEISGESSRQKYDKKVQELAQTVSIPGFRKGKVPKQILLQRLGTERIKAAALEELIQESVEKAIAQEEITYIGGFRLRSDFEGLVQQYQPGEVLTFAASVDVPPEVELQDYSNISVKAEETLYDPETVEQLLAEKRAQKATLIPVEGRLAQLNDLAVIDYQGKENKEETIEPISGVEGENFEMELVTEKFIPGFVDGIVGMNLEETKSITLTFPEDYPREDLQGKEVIFTITLKELKEKELPPLDDEFAQDVSDFLTMDELKASLEEQYREQAEQETKNACHTAILADLVAKHDIPIPESMLEEEVTQILTQTAMQIQQMGVDVKKFFTPDALPTLRENARPDAIKKIKERLILQAIAEKESITPTTEAIDNRITEVKTELAGQNIDENRLKQMIVQEMVTENTLNWLQEKATVELVPKGSLSEPTTETEVETETETETETEVETTDTEA
jgi:trigger factor